MLLEEVGGCASDEEVEAEEHDGQVIELPEHGHEVRDEIDREKEIRANSREDELLLRGDPAIAKERPDQTDVRRKAADEIHDPRHVLRCADAVSHSRHLPAGSVPAEP